MAVRLYQDDVIQWEVVITEVVLSNGDGRGREWGSQYVGVAMLQVRASPKLEWENSRRGDLDNRSTSCVAPIL